MVPPKGLSRGKRGGTGAYKELSENWLCPDSHGSSQPQKALSPECSGPKGAGGENEGLAGSGAMRASGQATGRASEEHIWRQKGPGSQPLPKL